jgi:Fe2+ transport system protein FeoA
MTVCALCGFTYAPGGVACHERSCPLAALGCSTEHCPRCGHAAVDETRSLLARWARRLLTRRRPADAAPASHRLATLDAGRSAVVAAIDGDPGLQARLAAQGLAPGVEVRLVQTWPSYVVEMGETTLAFEPHVAECVRLEGCPDPDAA